MPGWNEADPATPTSLDDALGMLALRYAASELNAADADAFEERLGYDPAAQEALAEAIRLSHAATGVGVVQLSSGWRKSFLQRVWPSFWNRVFPLQRYRGHPAIWVCAGVLTMLGTWSVTIPLRPNVPPSANHPSAQERPLAHTDSEPSTLAIQPPQIQEQRETAIAQDAEFKAPRRMEELSPVPMGSRADRPEPNSMEECPPSSTKKG